MKEDLNKAIETMLENIKANSYTEQINQINEKIKNIIDQQTIAYAKANSYTEQINQINEKIKNINFSGTKELSETLSQLSNFINQQVYASINKPLLDLNKINIDISNLLRSVNSSTEIIKKAEEINNLFRERFKKIFDEDENDHFNQHFTSIEKEITDYYNEVRDVKTLAEEKKDKNNIKDNLEITERFTNVINNVISIVFYLIMIYYTLFPKIQIDDEVIKNIQEFTESLSIYEQQMIEINKRLEQETTNKIIEKRIQETSDTLENQIVQSSEKTDS